MGTKWGFLGARRQHASTEQHSLRTPLLVNRPFQDQPTEAVSLQAWIMQWHEEHLCKQALCQEPGVVCIQLERRLGLGREACLRVEFGPGESLLPCFQLEGLEVTYMALICHHCHSGPSRSNVRKRPFPGHTRTSQGTAACR